MLFVTHIISAQPAESQVYLNHIHGLPIAVGVIAPRTNWMIENGRVRLLE